MEKKTILIVDDDKDNRQCMADILKQDYVIIQASDGEQALKQIGAHFKSLVLIFLDVRMPRVNGFKVIEIMNKKKIMKQVPVILMTREATPEAKLKGFDLGAIDVWAKPIDTKLIRRRVKTLLEVYKSRDYLEFVTREQNKILKQQADILKKMSSNILDMMSTIVEFRSFESSSHIQKVKAFVRIIGNYIAEYYKEYQLNSIEIQLIADASSMHDIGKIMIPDNILQKPGELTPEEYEVMKSHTTKGCEIIDSIAAYQDEMYYQYSYDICRYHHERYDGNGYPEGLKGDSIPICAQIVSIAEVFDALISDRIYKEAISVEEAYLMITDGECGIFSPKLLECFNMARKEIEEVLEKYKERERE